MNDAPRHALCDLCRRYGHAVADDPRRLGGLLRDECGQFKREIGALVAAADVKVPQALLGSPAVPFAVLEGTLVAKLLDTTPLADDAATWAVRVWGEAVGRLDVPTVRSADFEKTKPYPPETAAETPPAPKRGGLTVPALALAALVLLGAAVALVWTQNGGKKRPSDKSVAKDKAEPPGEEPGKAEEKPEVRVPPREKEKPPTPAPPDVTLSLTVPIGDGTPRSVLLSEDGKTLTVSDGRGVRAFSLGTTATELIVEGSMAGVVAMARGGDRRVLVPAAAALDAKDYVTALARGPYQETWEAWSSGKDSRFSTWPGKAEIKEGTIVLERIARPEDKKDGSVKDSTYAKPPPPLLAIHYDEAGKLYLANAGGDVIVHPALTKDGKGKLPEPQVAGLSRAARRAALATRAGKWLVVADDGERLWYATGRGSDFAPPQDLRGPVGPVAALSLSADGSVLATGRAGAVDVWRVQGMSGWTR